MRGKEMKVKKFLKLIKAHCKEENCGIGKCPMAVQRKGYVGCYMGVDEVPENWDIEAMVKAVKKVKGGKYGK